MPYPFFLFVIGLLPSLIWLLYFLRKDVHPESNRQIIKVFILGMLAAPPTAFLELNLNNFGFLNPEKFIDSPRYLLILLLYFIIVIGLAEETAKYLITRFSALRHSELDEPPDIMFYMIIAALGFAAAENILIFLAPEAAVKTLAENLNLAIFRFLSATFLHALASGTIGFFVALSYCYSNRKTIFLFSGIGLAAVLHGLYNFSIITLRGELKFLVPSIILISLAVFVTLGLKKLKTLKSICVIKM